MSPSPDKPPDAKFPSPDKSSEELSPEKVVPSVKPLPENPSMQLHR
jgi:hypothetical protein